MSIPKGSLNYFCDESDLKRKMMLVGGFFIPKANMIKLDEVIVKVKLDNNLEEIDPIKWSMSEKDYKQSINKINKSGGIEKLKIDMLSIVKVKELLNIRLLMAMCYKGKPTLRDFTWKLAFEWVLQRLSIILDRKKEELKDEPIYPFLDVICDWFPSESKRDEFFRVYQTAYIEGYPHFRLRALREFKACPCLLFSSSDFSLALQLADFFIGATREFLLGCFGEDPDRYRQGVEKYFPIIFNTFHRDPRKGVIGYGLTAPDRSSRDKINNKLKELNLKES